MGAINISFSQVLAVVALSSTITTAIFWGAFLIGRAMHRIERLESRVDDHEQVIREFKSVGL
jgi:hypothetical protein